MQIPSQVGPYQVLDVLGRGGMGLVLRARHEQLEGLRAVKLMLPGRGPRSGQRLARFMREVEALARVRHPNVVAVHDSGALPDGALYFAMDLVEGEPLDQVLARGRPPLEEALRIGVGIARGVGALHAAGLVHRDLKPSNVILAADRPVVLDLGLAVDPESDERLTQTGVLVGTPAYMAPEQLCAGEATPRLDVYALGLIAFELLTGRPAVEVEGLGPELVGRILNTDRPRPTAVDPDLPLALDAVLGRALARDPAARYPDAVALADALEAVRAAPGSTRRGRRRRLLALCGATVLGLAAGALALGRQADPAAHAAAARSPAQGATPTPTPVPAPSPPAAASLDERALREGERRLRQLRRLAPEEQQAAALAWLEAFPGHPQAGEAERLGRRAIYGFPLARLPAAVSGALLHGGEAALLWGTAEGLRRCALTGPAPPARLALEGRALVMLPTADGGAFVAVRARVHRLGAAGQVLASLEARAPVLTLALSPGERLLAVGSQADHVEVWGVADGALQARLGPHGAPVFTLAFSPDGRHLASGSGTSDLSSKELIDLSARLWDVASGDLRWRKDLNGRASALAFARGGREVLAGTDQGSIYRLDVDTGQSLGALRGRGTEVSAFDPSPPAHTQSVVALGLSADGRRVLSAACGTRGVRGQQGVGIDYAVWDAETFLELSRRPVDGFFVQASFGQRRGQEDLLLLTRVEGASSVWLVDPEPAASPEGE